jgi:4,5-DOPA dioxygenase extradiol
VQKLLSPVAVTLDDSWGLDHGTWSVLVHAFPKADVPVIQLSIDRTQAATFHFDLPKKLAPLRDDGVLIMGSGNVVHNLNAYAWGRPGAQPYDWAMRFEQRVRELALAGEDAALIDYEGLGQDAALSIPTPEHYLPLLYVLALRKKGEPITFPTQGIEGGSLSMLSLRVG